MHTNVLIRSYDPPNNKILATRCNNVITRANIADAVLDLGTKTQ